jgi:hypothetical protein
MVKPNGIDDQILICNKKGATILGSYFNQIQNNPINFFTTQTQDNKMFSGEGFLKTYLDKFDIKVVTNPLSNYRLVRYSQINTDQPFNFLDQ